MSLFGYAICSALLALSMGCATAPKTPPVSVPVVAAPSEFGTLPPERGAPWLKTGERVWPPIHTGPFGIDGAHAWLVLVDGPDGMSGFVFMPDLVPQLTLELPPLDAGGTVHSVDAVTFPDADGDGAVEIVIHTQVMTGMGPEGAIPFPVVHVFGLENGRFVARPAGDAPASAEPGIEPSAD